MKPAAAHGAPPPPLAETLQGRLVEFTRLARANGFQAGIAETLDALRAARVCGLTHMQRLRWGLRGLLCGDRNNWRRFDQLFDAYWKPESVQRIWTQSDAAAPVARRPSPVPGAGAGRGESRDAYRAEPEAGEDAASGGGAHGGASKRELLARTDFRFITDADEMRKMEQLVERLAKRMRRLMVRRQKIHRRGRRVHLRRTVRNSLQYGGVPLELALQRPGERQPRLFLLVDVSRSMSLYSYLFLRFARGIAAAFRDAAVFAFHTRLVRITDALEQPNLAKTGQRLALISAGWSGGTRIGECVGSFLAQYGHRLNSRSLVLIVSDGLETGDPELLGRHLATVKSRCRKLIWLNPLLGRPGYEPRSGGMAAALPCLDLFASAHNLASLRALEAELAGV